MHRNGRLPPKWVLGEDGTVYVSNHSCILTTPSSKLDMYSGFHHYYTYIVNSISLCPGYIYSMTFLYECLLNTNQCYICNRCTIIDTSSIHWSSISKVRFRETASASSPPMASRSRHKDKFGIPSEVVESKAFPITVTHWSADSCALIPPYRSGKPSEQRRRKQSSVSMAWWYVSGVFKT